MVEIQALTVVWVVIPLVMAGLGWRWWQRWRQLQSLRSLPAPPGNWFSGNVPELMALAKAGQFSQQYLQWVQDYGALFVTWVFNKPILIVSKPRAIEQILTQGQADGTFIRSPAFYGAYQDIFGVHIGNQIGSEWKWRRQAAMPTFKPSRFASKLDVIIDGCLAVVVQIQQAAQGQEPIQVDPLFVDLTMGVIAHFLLGVSPEGQPNFEGEPLFEPQTLYSTLAVLEKQVLLQSAGKSKWLKYLPTQDSQTYWDAQRYQQAFLGPRVAMALQLAHQNESQPIPEVGQPFRDSILVQLAKNPQHTQGSLLAEAKAFLFAGHDTTAHTLSFAVGELGLNPKVRQRAQAIVDQVWEQQEGLHLEALKGLVYIEAVVKETMRLHPVAPGIPLVAARDTELEGIHIPKRTGVEPFFLGAGRDPQMYPQPQDFRPERWLSSDQSPEEGGKQPLQLGFSLGAHYCVGAPLALLEATVMLAALLHHFDWELVNGARSLTQLDQNLTIFPRDRMPVHFTERITRSEIANVLVA
jgi:unspecific monooxygenase